MSQFKCCIFFKIKLKMIELENIAMIQIMNIKQIK